MKRIQIVRMEFHPPSVSQEPAAVGVIEIPPGSLYLGAMANFKRGVGLIFAVDPNREPVRVLVVLTALSEKTPAEDVPDDYCPIGTHYAAGFAFTLWGVDPSEWHHGRFIRGFNGEATTPEPEKPEDTICVHGRKFPCTQCEVGRKQIDEENQGVGVSPMTDAEFEQLYAWK